MNKTLPINAPLNQEVIELITRASGVGLWDWQIDTQQMTVNELWAEQIGYRLEEVQPFDFDWFDQAIHPEDLPRVQENVLAHWQGEKEQYSAEYRITHKDGHEVWLQASGQVVERNDAGEPTRMIGINLDITERKIRDGEMQTTSQLLNESQKIAKVGGWELNLISGHLFWTDETYRIHDTSPEEFDPTVDAGVSYFLPKSRELITAALDAAINQGDNYDLELETYTTKGRKIDVRTTGIVTLLDGKAVKITGIFQDITEQKNIQRSLQQSNIELEQLNFTLENSANYDSLTNLPNRNLLADRMQQALARQQRQGHIVAICFIDLDGFKDINDKYGHDVGDKLLCRTAEAIKLAMRAEDTLARFGGDEFVAVLDNLIDLNVCEQILERMLETVRQPFVIDKHQLFISASIGVTLYPQDNSLDEQLIRHADQAMYIAKQLGKNRYHIFDVAEDVAVKHQHEEREAIRNAIQNREFVLYYQPKVQLDGAEVVGVEALVRWQHPSKGLLPPAMFLPIIEHDLLIIDLGEQVIRQAFEQLMQWQSKGLKIPISVNISPLQLQQNDFTDRLQSIIEQFPSFEAGQIIFEIVETAALSDFAQVSKVIDICHRMGVRFSIDDFGTGYSSLTYLKKLRAKELKIDRSFVRDMLDDSDDEAIVRGIIELARVFNLNVVAEGVETLEHGIKLYELGCKFAQGFGIARPMPADELNIWLEHWQRNEVWRAIGKN